MVRIHYFAAMVTVMQFSQFFFMNLVEELRKAFTKEKNNIKVLMTLLLLFYYFFMT